MASNFYFVAIPSGRRRSHLSVSELSLQKVVGAVGDAWDLGTRETLVFCPGPVVILRGGVLFSLRFHFLQYCIG